MLSISDLWNLLENKQFDAFNRIVIHDPDILNLHWCYDGNTFLIHGIIHYCEDIFNFLINYKHQIDFMACNDKKQTAFHLAVHNRRLEAMKSLLDIDPRGVNCVDINGETPLHYAAIKNNVLMASLLMHNGVDATIKSKRQKTAYDSGNFMFKSLVLSGTFR